MTGLLAGTRSGLVPRAVLLLAPPLALLATDLQGPRPSGWLVALTVALSVGFAAMPESMLGAAAFAVVLVWWAVAARAAVPVTAIAAALLLLAAHVAAILLAYGPAGQPVGGSVLRLWLRRAALVAVAAPAVWLLALLVEGRPEAPGIWVAGLASAIVVCVVAAVAVGTREPTS